MTLLQGVTEPRLLPAATGGQSYRGLHVNIRWLLQSASCHCFRMRRQGERRFCVYRGRLQAFALPPVTIVPD
jgi:hypothetical protein